VGPLSLVDLSNYLFHPYVDRQKRSLFVTWTSVLLQTAPGARDGLELDLDWASNLA
jgi:hypothetical protein